MNKTLLQINTSLFSDAGTSSGLANDFVAGWKKHNPAATVIVRDFAKEPVPHLTAERFQAFITKPEERNASQRAEAAYSDALIDELQRADVIVLVTSSPTPVLESGWVKPGAHVISVGACRPTQREMDPALVARARLFVDSRAAALVESGDVVMGIQEGRFGADHIVAELGELIADDSRAGRRNDTDVTIFKSLGLAVEDVTAAELAYRRAVERGIGQELAL